MQNAPASPLPRQPFFPNRVARFLNQGTMGFFALLALTLALIPVFFPQMASHPRLANALYAGQWIVVGIFALDYVAHFLLAEFRSIYALSRVRIVYAVIIVVAAASLLESVPDAFVAAPVLHLFNVLAAVLFGARASAVAVERLEPSIRKVQPSLPNRVFVAHPDQNEPFSETTWLELIKWTNEPSSLWYHAESVGEKEMHELSKSTLIPEAVLKSCLGQENYPRIFNFGKSVLISLWLRISEENGATSDIPLVMILNRQGLISLCPGSVHLHHRVKDRFGNEIALRMPFNLRALYSLFDFVLRSKQERIDAQEIAFRRLEKLPTTAFRTETLQEVYDLKSDVTSLRADLWRLKELLDRLEEGKIHFPGTEPAHHAAFNYLADDADFLFHTSEQLRENVVSLIDLHISRSGHEMNKFMRLLAVISALGFVPAAISGMLGMNIAGAPWPWSLPQVAFIVLMTCVFCLYYFVVKGWLR